jgi:hypothetical protein
MSVPRDGKRMAAIEPGANATIVAGLSGLFNNQSVLGEQYKTGVHQDRRRPGHRHVAERAVAHGGPLGGTPLVNGANQGLTNAGSTDNPYAATTSLVTDGWTAAAATRLNSRATRSPSRACSRSTPRPRQSTGVLQSFLVTADVASDARATPRS